MKMIPPREWMVGLAQRGAGECRECRQRGFTLVELMIALTLSIFLIGAVILTFISGRGASLEAEQLARTQENLRFASDFLIRDIRNAGFRDQLTLHYPQYREIGRCFAKYGNVGRSLEARRDQPCSSTGDNERLTIRYAGRGACGLAFQDDGELKLIENTYFLEDGELRCLGTEIGLCQVRMLET
jgi:prepilin-type N-terminal cleavage/methylation domain-containing protein